MSAPQVLLATVATAVGALVLGAVGFGSLLVLFDVHLVPDPALVAGWAVSQPLARRLDRGYTRPAVLVVSAAVAGLLVLRRLG